MKSLPPPSSIVLLRTAVAIIVVLAIATGYYATRVDNLQQRLWRLERVCQTAQRPAR